MSAWRRKTFVLADSGKMLAFGWMAFGSLGLGNKDSSDKVLEPVGIREHHIAQVSAGLYHTVAVDSDGLLLPFGDNEKGQLGFDSGFLQRAT